MTNALGCKKALAISPCHSQSLRFSGPTAPPSSGAGSEIPTVEAWELRDPHAPRFKPLCVFLHYIDEAAAAFNTPDGPICRMTHQTGGFTAGLTTNMRQGRPKAGWIAD